MKSNSLLSGISKIFTCIMFLCFCLVAQQALGVQPFEVDGIYYTVLTDDTVAVTQTPEGVAKYSGDIVIPSTVDYQGETYNVASIAGEAFAYCNSLDSVFIPNSVVSIGIWAFRRCSSLTSIIIPGSVTHIGEGIFSFCDDLASIEVRWSAPPTSVIPVDLGLEYDDCTLIVPRGTTSLYQGSSPWSFFGDIEETALSVFTLNLSFGANDPNGQTVAVKGVPIGNIAWEAISESWLTIYPSQGSTDGTFTVTAAPNDSTERKAEITVTNGIVTHYISVTQAFNPALGTSHDSVHFTAKAPQDIPITVKAYTNWEVSKDSSWIKLTPLSPSGKMPGTFTVSVELNDSTERQGKITVTNGDSTISIPVTQAAYPLLKASTDSLHYKYNETAPQHIDVVAYPGVTWTVSRDSTWITLDPSSPLSGDGNGYFTVAIDSPNDSTERKGNVTITNGDTTINIPVMQAADPLLKLSTDSLAFGVDSPLELVVNVTSYSDWQVSKDSAWITLNTTSGSGRGEFTVTVEHNTGTARKGKVTVTNGDSTISIPVTQPAAPQYIHISEDSLFFGPEEGELTFIITSNIAWTVVEEIDWLTVSPMSGVGATRLVTVTVEANATAMREDDIIISGATGQFAIHITQAAPPPMLFPNSLSFGPDELAPKCVTVTASGDWEAEVTKGDWINIDPESSSGNGNGEFCVTATANSTGSIRTGEITFVNGDTSIIYSVSQSAVRYMRISADTLFFGAKSSLTQNLMVTSSDDWEVSSDVSWLTLNTNSGSGNGVLHARATLNTGDAREETITITSSNTSFTIHVLQEANNEIRFMDKGIYYYAPDRYGDEVEVTFSENNAYNNYINIPGTATYSAGTDQKTYIVTRIGEKAFYECGELTHVTIPNSVVDIGDRAFSYCDKLISVRIPNSVTRIGEWAFCDCINMASITIPNSVTKIMNGAFYNCSKFTSIDIPATVSEIACMAFSACSNLTAMNVYWETPPRVPNINPDFSDYVNCTLYVPAGMKKSYILNWYWASFANVIERDATSADKVTKDIVIRTSNGKLHVDTPSAETVYVYSFTGKLLYTATKAAGKATFGMFSNNKLLIVRGSSGWTKKVLNQ